MDEYLRALSCSECKQVMVVTPRGGMDLPTRITDIQNKHNKYHDFTPQTGRLNIVLYHAEPDIDHLKRALENSILDIYGYTLVEELAGITV